MTESKRRRCSSKTNTDEEGDKSDVEIPKRRRAADFFGKDAHREKLRGLDCLGSVTLANLPEASLVQIEEGNTQVSELKLDQHGSFLSYYPSLACATCPKSVFNREKIEILRTELLKKPGGARTILPWSQGRLKVFGKEHTERRFTCFFADDVKKAYSYSGRTDLQVNSWTDPSVCPPELKDLRDHVSALCGYHFDTALLNYYRNGEDCIGWHADDEAIYGGRMNAKGIVGVSFGAARDFQIRPKPSKKKPALQAFPKHRDKLSICLKGEGSILIMGGTMQQHWQHCVPPRKRVASPRISVTFRRVPTLEDSNPRWNLDEHLLLICCVLSLHGVVMSGEVAAQSAPRVAESGGLQQGDNLLLVLRKE
eukprot:CAMPEP_0181309486 /NCGR_PEP_ID=MMETSP1101-20121128/12038_1 /TAXON_ID=46948 /ORGANISM="Rhodomonas abbreviata, Strain Caron Lab Isolate" /LENGTH=366 /DNA_ID=CAMNT_0023415971 /DNA_START=149 /DNA_END=1250 /DNA_ORIENTATION=+